MLFVALKTETSEICPRRVIGRCEGRCEGHRRCAWGMSSMLLLVVVMLLLLLLLLLLLRHLHLPVGL